MAEGGGGGLNEISRPSVCLNYMGGRGGAP